MIKLSLVVLLGLGCRAASPRPNGSAEVFGPGVFSTAAWDFFVAFSPDETRALFGRADDAFETFALYETRLDARGRWTAPTRPRCASAFSDADPHIYRVSLEDVMPNAHRTVTVAPGGAYALAYEVAGPTRTVYISGQIPTRADSSVPEGFEAQCRQVWANIDAVLADAAMTRRDLVKVTTYLSDRSYRDLNSRIRREVLGDHLPALTIIITGIYDPAWLLEIEATAAR